MQRTRRRAGLGKLRRGLKKRLGERKCSITALLGTSKNIYSEHPKPTVLMWGSGPPVSRTGLRTFQEARGRPHLIRSPSSSQQLRSLAAEADRPGPHSQPLLGLLISQPRPLSQALTEDPLTKRTRLLERNSQRGLGAGPRVQERGPKALAQDASLSRRCSLQRQLGGLWKGLSVAQVPGCPHEWVPSPALTVPSPVQTLACGDGQGLTAL